MDGAGGDDWGELVEEENVITTAVGVMALRRESICAFLFATSLGYCLFSCIPLRSARSSRHQLVRKTFLLSDSDPTRYAQAMF